MIETSGLQGQVQLIQGPEVEQLTQSGVVLLFCFFLAFATGIFAALAKRLGVRDTIVAAGLSGVGGTVVGATCVYLWGADRWYLTCAGCGVAGWLGGDVILDRLSFVAWTIVQGKLPAAGNSPVTFGGFASKEIFDASKTVIVQHYGAAFVRGPGDADGLQRLQQHAGSAAQPAGGDGQDRRADPAAGASGQGPPGPSR